MCRCHFREREHSLNQYGILPTPCPDMGATKVDGMSYLDDPRVYFAAERTLLAWIRTGITTIGLGFVVAKFGIFLRYIAPHDAIPANKPELSLAIGTVMVVLGALTCLGAAIQFQRFVKTLSEKELPPHWFPFVAGWIAYAMAMSGIAMAIYLVL